jgi:hypothetical protein
MHNFIALLIDADVDAGLFGIELCASRLSADMYTAI